MKTQEDYYQEFVEEVNGLKSFIAFLSVCVTTPPENELQALARVEFTENWRWHFEELGENAESIYCEQKRLRYEQRLAKERITIFRGNQTFPTYRKGLFSSLSRPSARCLSAPIWFERKKKTGKGVFLVKTTKMKDYNPSIP